MRGLSKYSCVACPSPNARAVQIGCVPTTDTVIQLKETKRFSLLWGIIWFLLGGFPLIVYIIYYLSRKDKIATIQKEITVKKEETLKQCPKCDEKVQPAAMVCKHCGHEFSETE